MKDRTRGGGRPAIARVEAALASVREEVERLVEENEALRSDPQRPNGADTERVRALELRLERLEEEKQALQAELERGSRTRRGHQDDLLANLYVAGFHLHRTLQLDAVLASIKEILINLVGAERFAIYLLDGQRRTLMQIADEQCRRPAPRRIPIGEGIAGVVAKTGIAYFDLDQHSGDYHNPLACVAMKVDGQVIGVIQVNQLFVQKQSLTTQDHELFSLLAETAGAALLAATLRQRYHSEEPAAGGWGSVLIPYLEAFDGAVSSNVLEGLDSGEDLQSQGRSN